MNSNVMSVLVEFSNPPQVLPVLLDEMKNMAMAPFVLPSIFAVTEASTAAEFEQYVHHMW